MVGSSVTAKPGALQLAGMPEDRLGQVAVAPVIVTPGVVLDSVPCTPVNAPLPTRLTAIASVSPGSATPAVPPPEAQVSVTASDAKLMLGFRYALVMLVAPVAPGS